MADNSNLLNHDQIVAGSHACQDRPAIYFLVKDGRVVYVGKSIKNIHSRIGCHISERKKPFSRYYAVYCDSQDLDATEAAYVEALKPMYNNYLNRRDYSVDKHCAAILATVSSC